MWCKVMLNDNIILLCYSLSVANTDVGYNSYNLAQKYRYNITSTDEIKL